MIAGLSPEASAAAGWIWAAFLSLCLGSFATALAWRVPRGVPWIWDRGEAARSACAHCGHVLGPADLVPLFSWLAARGRCRYCAAPVGARYPLMELATLLAGLGAYAAFGLSAKGAMVLLAVPFLVALAEIDFRHRLLPDQLVAAVAVLGVLNAAFAAFAAGTLAPVAHAALSASGYAALAWGLGWLVGRILRKEALGFGDVKFFAAAGVWLGLPALPFFLILSGGLGVLLGLGWKAATKDPVFPFGPALIGALYGMLILSAFNVPGIVY